MHVNGKPTRTIWPAADAAKVSIIDQTRLPHAFVTCELETLAQVADAIKEMKVRGAPLIGVATAYGLALALRDDSSDAGLDAACATLIATRPTAVNLAWVLAVMRAHVQPLPHASRAAAAFAKAGALADADVALCAAIGDHGMALIKAAARHKQPVNILTHCNAGWLCAVDWGTATAPIYKADAAGIAIHVFVGETRPRNQGAALTAWELGQQGISHQVIVDNAGGHLMQRGSIDLVIVGTDRTTATGDVCNKIGTYLKALAATDNNVPFYVAAPSSSIDFAITDGAKEIPIEERHAREVTHMRGMTADGRIETVRVTPESSPAANPAFDVTPARLITGLITERGIVAAEQAALATAFPERVTRKAQGLP
jgi:methylthioribose-1-phosphate isomerase